MLKEPIKPSILEFLVGILLTLLLVVLPMTTLLKLTLSIFVIIIIVHLIDRSPWTIQWNRFIKTVITFGIIFIFLAYQFICIVEIKGIIMTLHNNFDNKPQWLVYLGLCIIGSILICSYWGITGKIFRDSVKQTLNPVSSTTIIQKVDLTGNLKQRAINLSNEIMQDLFNHGWPGGFYIKKDSSNSTFGLNAKMPTNPKQNQGWIVERSSYFRWKFDKEIRELKNEFSQLHLRDKELDDFFKYLDMQDTSNKRLAELDPSRDPHENTKSIILPQQIESIAYRFQVLAQQIKD
jgi:hypothetical protein